MSKNDLSLGYRIFEPGKRKRSTMLGILLRAIDTRTLPDDFPDTELIWRNTARQDQRSDDFLTAMNESRSGFHTLVRRRLLKDIAYWRDVERQQTAERRAKKQRDLADRERDSARRRRAAAARKGWARRRKTKTAKKGKRR